MLVTCHALRESLFLFKCEKTTELIHCMSKYRSINGPNYCMLNTQLTDVCIALLTQTIDYSVIHS